MCILRIARIEVESADRYKAHRGYRRMVEDPIPDPEPAAPSLGYPDPEIFHHSPSFCANAVLNVRAEHQPPIGPVP
jgi:hypothetical protein